MKKAAILLFALLANWTLFAQSINETPSVMLMKANVLFESGRYDEAVRMYNKVLSADEGMTQALLMRAKAKYELGAFKGTKMDVIQFIETDGVTKDILPLMAKTERKLGNMRAAKNYVSTAIEVDPYSPELHLLAGEIASETDHRSYACEMYDVAAALGSAKARYRIEEECYNIRRTSSKVRYSDTPSEADVTEAQASTKDSSPEDPTPTDAQTETEKKDDDGIVSLEDIVQEAEQAEKENNPNTSTTTTSTTQSSTNSSRTPGSRIDKDAVQSVEIDSKLYIDITNGLGARKLTYKPNIFMLSDQDGTVVIDVCVDADGKVEEASFNRDLSTIFRSSLTSLALRKAKSFTFEKSDRPEQCGRLVYNIRE